MPSTAKNTHVSAARKAASKKLFEAVLDNDPAAALAALASGGSPDARPRGQLGHTSASGQDTAFMRALRLGHSACAEALFPLIKLSATPFYATDALALAVATKNMDWVSRVLPFCAKSELSHEKCDALKMAADLEFFEATELLIPLSSPPQINQALARSIVRGNPRSAIALAGACLDLNAPCPPEAIPLDYDAAPPLAIAARHGRWSIAKALMELGANPRISGARGETLLMIAASHGRAEFVSAALTYCDPAAVDQLGENALMKSARALCQDSAQILFPVSDIQARNKKSQTASDIAASVGGPQGRGFEEQLKSWREKQELASAIPARAGVKRRRGGVRI